MTLPRRTLGYSFFRFSTCRSSSSSCVRSGLSDGCFRVRGWRKPRPGRLSCCHRAVEVERSAARHEQLTDRLARAAVPSSCPVGCRSRPAVSPRAPRVGTEKTSGDGRGPSSQLPGRGGGAVRGGRGDGGRARASSISAGAGKHTVAMSHACMFRARPRGQNSERACCAPARPGRDMAWGGVQGKESCMHGTGECAASCAADGAQSMHRRRAAAHTWRRVHAPAGRPRRAVAFLSCPRRNHGCACRRAEGRAFRRTVRPKAVVRSLTPYQETPGLVTIDTFECWR